MKAEYIGRLKDKYSDAVYLFYRYRGHEYMIFDGHNGYSEALVQQHKYEQGRIDKIIAGEKSPTGPYEDPMKALDLLYEE